jgi:hypothetical protein
MVRMEHDQFTLCRASRAAERFLISIFHSFLYAAFFLRVVRVISSLFYAYLYAVSTLLK